MANFHHNNRNHGYRGRGRKNQSVENRENKEVRENDENKEQRENKERFDQQEARAMYRERRERENRERENKDNRDGRDNRNNREIRNNDSKDNQAITTFMLGEKELEGKNAQFQYDKGWYSITDIIGEEKNVIYKSKNAQEAYTKWNVYIGRKKERPQRAEKAEN